MFGVPLRSSVLTQGLNLLSLTVGVSVVTSTNSKVGSVTAVAPNSPSVGCTSVGRKRQEEAGEGTESIDDARRSCTSSHQESSVVFVCRPLSWEPVVAWGGLALKPRG